MHSVIPGLYASAPERLPFGPSLEIRTFLLCRDRGNLLVYSASTLASERAAVSEVGGIARHYLNHGHEAGFGCAMIADEFHAPLHCHESERRSVEAKCAVAGTFSNRHMIDDDFEAIPIPGHTAGATAYLWDSGEHRCLFTGDSLHFNRDRWVAVVAGSSDRATYIESLELICDLDFDVLVPWVAPAGHPFHALIDKSHARRQINAVIDRVRGGEHN